jgi:hypothetical protein
MSAQSAFTLHIFVADGEPDGLRLVERSNWIGKGVIFPRAIYPTVRRRPEFENAGVYLLIGPRAGNDSDSIYISEKVIRFGRALSNIMPTKIFGPRVCSSLPPAKSTRHTFNVLKPD